MMRNIFSFFFSLLLLESDSELYLQTLQYIVNIID